MPAYNGEYEDIIRPFVDGMRYKLANNKHKGQVWRDQSLEKLFELAKQEINELEEAIQRGNTIEIMLEAADVGNFVMFIAKHAVERASQGHGSDTSKQTSPEEYSASVVFDIPGTPTPPLVYEVDGVQVSAGEFYRGVAERNVKPVEQIYEFQGRQVTKEEYLEYLRSLPRIREVVRRGDTTYAIDGHPVTKEEYDLHMGHTFAQRDDICKGFDGQNSPQKPKFSPTRWGDQFDKFKEYAIPVERAPKTDT